MLALSYVLVPETRAYWDAAPLLGHQATARTLAAAVVAARRGKATDELWRLEIADLTHVRTALHYRFAADLAVGLSAIGRPEGPALLETLGPAGRTMLQDLTSKRTPRAKQARALLAAVPAPPPMISHLGVLGPLVLSREDERSGERREVIDPDLRRSRVRALLSYLVSYRRTHRGAIGAALWPDLDDKALANNLGVTLSYLLNVLEPWRTPGEASYLVRLDGHSVELATDHYLHLDIDAFDEHLALAERAEADGTPSLALDHHLAAAALYRGDLFGDVPEAVWVDLDRGHFRKRFVTTATRAAELLVGRGDHEQAETIVQRALTADPWNENAYAVLAAAALERGNRSAARQALAQCLAALAELGAEPSDAIRHLTRRAGLATATPGSSRTQRVS
jgi:DNA-binding SARP family transcriptional activator